MEAVNLAENTVIALKEIRTNTDQEFHQIFLKAEVIRIKNLIIFYNLYEYS